MKIKVTLKDPDTMYDAVVDAVHKNLKTSVQGISNAEREALAGDRIAEFQSDISDKWMRYGEYLTVEFDTEAGTATVLPASAMD